jgi:hypothetical protein
MTERPGLAARPGPWVRNAQAVLADRDLIVGEEYQLRTLHGTQRLEREWCQRQAKCDPWSALGFYAPGSVFTCRRQVADELPGSGDDPGHAELQRPARRWHPGDRQGEHRRIPRPWP